MTGMALRGWCLVILLGMVVAAGCSQPGVERPATETVSGTVTLGGSAVEGAIVTFVAANGGESAVGKTDASGKYELTTWVEGDGAMAGDYNVKIVKYEEAAPADESGIEADDEGAYIPDTPENSGDQANLLPAKYSNPGTSGLTATVAAGANTLDFALEE